jgi:hypothetical protein
MPAVSLNGVNFSGLEWKFKLLLSKHTETSISQDRPFISAF